MVTILRSIDEIGSVETVWRRWESHPTSQFDAFCNGLTTEAAVINPFVLVVTAQDGPECLVAGRLLRTELEFKVGYLPVYRTTARVISVVDRGILGSATDSCNNSIVSEILDALRRGEADMAHLACVPTKSHLYGAVSRLAPLISRSVIQSTERRWLLKLPGSYQQFLNSLSPKSRSTLSRSQKKLEKALAGRLHLRCVTTAEEVKAGLDDVEAVAAKAYQRRLGTGFLNTPGEREQLCQLARLGMLSIDLLYVNSHPVAFCYGVQSSGVYLYETPGYDPQLADLRVGNYLLLKLIERLCADSSVHTVDFGLGDAQYKQVYSNCMELESHLRIFAPTWKGVSLNGARTVTTLTTQVMTESLKKLGIYARLKRKARATRSQRRDEHAGA
jgi:CelD/BcsL family acetyltransferase involved in cellulose biosynthesis